VTVLITGPTGAVGQYVVEHALKADEQVRVLAMPHTLHRLPYRNRIEIVPGSLDNDDALAEAVAGVDIVFHTAVIAPPPNLAPEDMQHVNTLGTRRLLEACAGDVGRFVFVGSVNVFTPHVTPDTWPVRDNAPRLAHGNPALVALGQSLIDAEDFIFEAHSRYGMPYAILRPTVVCGRTARFAELTLRQLMRNPDQADRTNRMWGVMQWVHGIDVARAALLAARDEAAANECFIVAGNEPVTAYSLLAEVWDITNPLDHNPFAEGAAANTPPFCKFDIGKIQELLGFAPEIPLRQCLAELLGRYDFFSAASLSLPSRPSVLEFEL
jgi:nucleoside-diphosphate-sugar epimerase